VYPILPDLPSPAKPNVAPQRHTSELSCQRIRLSPQEAVDMKPARETAVLLLTFFLINPLSGCSPPPHSLEETKMYQPEEVREDFATLYENLEASA
jgi:hypothetical protein